MSRWLAIAVVAVVGCRKAGDFSGVSTPVIEPEPEPAGIKIEPPPPGGPLDDPTLGRAPASNPRGAPVAIHVVPLAVGAVRVRDLELRAVYDFEYEDRKHRQLSHDRYVLREELVKIEGENLIFKVEVERATEAVLLKDKPHEATTLSGTYLVGVFPPGAEHKVGASREDGSELGGRELEELSGLFQLDSGKPHLLVEIVTRRPLRVGESYVLTKDENILFGGGREVLGAISFTLLRVAGGVAHYQVDMTLHFPVEAGGTHERRMRMLIDVHVATGKLAALQEIYRDLETGQRSREATARHLTMRLTYPER